MKSSSVSGSMVIRSIDGTMAISTSPEVANGKECYFRCSILKNSKRFQMKYILLDFDGVLTSDAFTRQCIFEHRRGNLFGVEWFAPSCIEALRYLVEETGAKIVVSSSWRDLGEYRLRKLLE